MGLLSGVGYGGYNYYLWSEATIGTFRENNVKLKTAAETLQATVEKMAADQKMVAVIHRSSIGSRVDSKYVERKNIALERGYLWGAYHLGRRGNTIAQADLFYP